MSSTGDSAPQARPNNNPTNHGGPSNFNPNISRPPLAPTIRFGVTATVRATQHQLPSTGLGRGGFSVGGGATTGAPQATNNNAGEVPQQTQNLFQMRDRLFLALFFRVSLIYARAFPKTLRRVLEFCLFMQSILLLFILGYIHIVYTRTPITCLSEYKDSWPKNGILRVEITSEAGDDYNLGKSYGKEDKLRQRVAASQFGHYTDDLLSIMLTADSILLDRVVSTAGGLIATMTGSGDATKASSGTTATPAENKNVVDVIPTSSVETEPPDSSSATSSITASSISTSSMLTSGEGQDSISDTSEVTSSGVDGSEGSESSKKSEELDSGQSNKSIEIEEDLLVAAAEGEERASPDVEAISPSIPITASGEGSVGGSAVVSMTDALDNIDVNNPDSAYFNMTFEEIELHKMHQKQIEEDKLLNSSVTDFEMFANSGMNLKTVYVPTSLLALIGSNLAHPLEQAYIVEYALEYGFLRLSPETREKLGIPVKLVTLDPNKEACFGDQVSLFLLENFLGYDDILMSSIKNLAESEENKGYLRNVVTGEQFRFVPMWMARSSYIPALLIMLVFTVSISMLLRYSHHQIFVFIVNWMEVYSILAVWFIDIWNEGEEANSLLIIRDIDESAHFYCDFTDFPVDLLNNIEGAGSIHIPAAPLFTVILALVGMEAIMSEFFNDTTTAFYVILIVWIADQYDSVCSHTNITKVYWVRFFYLYHFAFYAYHYRFNGQYGGLALLVSWSFIQHSMVYFYHHYELPAILRQAHQPGHLPSETFGRERDATGQSRQVPVGETQPQQNVNNAGPGSASSLPSQSPPSSNSSSAESARNINRSGSDVSNSRIINPPISTSPVVDTNSITNILFTSVTCTSTPTYTTTQVGSPTLISPSSLSSSLSSTDATSVESQPQEVRLQSNGGGGPLSTSTSREENSLPCDLTSVPTIFNDRNINYNLAGDGDRMMRDNGASGVNNNDCNPTRMGMGQSESATTTNTASKDTFTSDNNTNTSSSSSFSPAQVSRESHLNLRMGEEGDVVQEEESTSTTTSPESIALNPTANNHSPFERRDGESVSSSSFSSHHPATAITGSSLRHRVAPRQSANGGGDAVDPSSSQEVTGPSSSTLSSNIRFIQVEEVD